MAQKMAPLWGPLLHVSHKRWFLEHISSEAFAVDAGCLYSCRMRCRVTVTHYRGSRLSQEGALAVTGAIGHLAIEEEPDPVKRRTTLVARVWTEAVYGKKGSTRLPRREAFRPLFDVRLLFIGRGVMILTGIEHTSTSPVIEYAQTWRVTFDVDRPSAQPGERRQTLLERAQAN